MSKEQTHKTNVLVTRFPFTSRFGGEEGHTLEVMKFLRSKNYDIHFWGSCPVLLEEFKKQDFESSKKWLYKPPVSALSLLLFTLLSPLLLLKGLRDVVKIRSKYGKHVKVYMLSFTEKLIYSPWMSLFNIKQIWLEHARFGNWFYKNPWKLWYKFWSKNNNVTVVTVSELMKKEMGMDWVQVIVNAVDGKKFKQIKDASSLPIEMRRAFAKKNFDIGFVGRFSEDKGVDLIVKAASEIDEAGFICCGSGDMKKRLDKADIDNMWLDKKLIPCFMQNIDLLVLPATKTDPFGLVVLEAMHAGTPVLLSDKCGVAYHLEDGVNAFICKPEDFSEKCKEIVENRDIIKEVSKNLDAALEQFDYQVMLDKYLELINS